MKCVKMPDGKIRRVTNTEAPELIKHGASYVKKEDWKKQKKEER